MTGCADLRGNAFLGPYVGLPSKENGLDVEGLAVSGDYVVLGLRGPVLGSHAFIVVLLLPHNGDGVLIPKNIDSKPYRLHALFLGGLGIRDLLFDGNRLLILAGPAQKTECMQLVYAIDDFLEPARSRRSQRRAGSVDASDSRLGRPRRRHRLLSREGKEDASAGRL